MSKMLMFVRANRRSVALFFAVLFGMIGSASAELSAAEQSLFDVIQQKVTDYTGPALAVLAAVLGLFITIKWMKRIVSKVS
jgi:hypothetical protein